MSRVSKKITNWLYTVLQPQYTHTEIAYRDVYRFLSVYLERGFKIRTAVYTSSSGGSDLLLNLYGPLTCGEIVFQINIWVPLNYPLADNSRNASNTDSNGVPIVFIVPSKGQVIRPGNNVDSQGKVYHPFLAQWYSSTSSGQTSECFNLLSLMERLVETFERSVPVMCAPTITGPALPPKPSRNLILNHNTGGEVIRNGPPLPEKLEASQNSMPQKYRAPPPLPIQNSPAQLGDIDQHNLRNAEALENRTPIPLARTNGIEHKWPKDESRICVPPLNSAHTAQQSPRRKAPSDDNTANLSNIEDLMDQVTLESARQDCNPANLQRITQNINMYLDSGSTGSLNSIIPTIVEIRGKATALHSQLSHHNNQAKANVANIDNHVQYLGKQVDSVSQLNKQLHELTEVNGISTDEISLSVCEDRKLALDDVILPDSMLVRQLYDTVADIKGYRDALKLVAGTYKSEAELISNETLDSCIRSVRALSRELFWLEVTRGEIGKVMGLE